MPTILDPRDCAAPASITVLAYPTPGSTTPPPADTCQTRTFIAYVLRQVEPKNNMVLRERLPDGTLGPPIGVFPGPKEGEIALGVDIGELIVYYTGRIAGDDSGPFQLQEQRVSVSDIWPMPEAALQRVRNLARLLVKHFPDLAGDFTPYLK